MKSGGLFSTTISCGALAGICAGAIWVVLITASIETPATSMSAFFFENAFRAGACLGTVLCAPAIYQRKIALTIKAAGWAVPLFIIAMVCGYVSWRLAIWITPSGNWEMIWIRCELLYIVMLCPLLGGGVGYLLSRVYETPHLAFRASAFGVLGCTIHLSFGLFFTIARLLKWDLDSPEAMALHITFAILGYVFLGAITGVPFDIYFRERAATETRGAV